MGKLKSLFLACAAVAFLGMTIEARATKLNVDGTGQLIGAQGVDVGGTLFDVEFVDGTCIDLFDGCDESSDFEVPGISFWEVAAQALLDQVFIDGPAGNFDSSPDQTSGCEFLGLCRTLLHSSVGPLNPFGFRVVFGFLTLNFADEAGDGLAVGGLTIDASDTTLSSVENFARFSVASIPEPFLVYEARTTGGTPTFEPRQVLLTDQFETGVFIAKRPVKLGTPADLNDEGVADSVTHLLGYKIKLPRGEPKHQRVSGIRVTDRFGEIVVDTVRPDRVLVPTAKDLDNPLDPPAPVGEDFKCYRVELADGEPDFAVQQVFVQDQFIEDQSGEPKLFDVLQPIRLCNPVDKDGEGITDADSHLMCYTVKRAEGEPKHKKVSGIHTLDQFGVLQVDAINVKELCVPSEKEIIE